MPGNPKVSIEKLTAIILCGGHSRRFGSDKARQQWKGRSLLDHVIEVCGARADQLILGCGREPRYASTGLTLALDDPAQDGPLAGIGAGLGEASNQLVFLAAVDLVGLTPRAIDCLIEVARQHPDSALIMPRTESGVEPLLWIGRRDPLQAAVQELVRSGDPAPRHLPEHVATTFIDVSTDPRDPLRRALTNVNTPADLDTLFRMTRLLIALSFLLAALLACRQLASADLGFHLKTGDHILSGHGWPKTDPFTTTMKDHPYIDTSWGFDVIVATAHQLAGTTGVGLLTIILTLAMLAMVALRARLEKKPDPLAVGLGLLAATIAMEMRYEPRPEMLSYAFLALMTFLLERRAAGRPTPIWSFVIVQWAWTNTHSLFVLGWLTMAIFLVGGWLERRKFDKPLSIAFLAAIAVSILNPYGMDGVRFPFTLLTRFQQSNPFAESIGEFVSPLSLKLSDQFPFYPVWPIWTFRVLVVLAALAIVPLWRRRRYTAILLMLAMFPLAAKMIRNIPLFVVVAVPAIVTAFPIGEWLARRRPIARQAVSATAMLVAVVLCLRVFHDAYYLDTRRPDRFGFGWNRFALPVESAAYINNHDLPGTMLNHINFGGYLMHATKGPVFIDGRLEVVGESFYNDYRRIFGSEVAFEQAVQRNNIGWIVTPYTIAPDLIRRLSADPRWRLVHVDNVAAVFVRADRADTKDRIEGLVDAKLAALLAPESPLVAWNQLPGMGGPPRAGRSARWVGGLLGRQQFPSDEFYVGLFCYLRKEYGPAEKYFTTAITKSNGKWYDPYANLGSVLWRQGDKDGSGAAYRVVLREDPQNRIARERVEK